MTNNKGFGLLESMVGLVLLGILSVALMGYITQSMLVANTSEAKNSLNSLVGSIGSVAMVEASCTPAITKVSQVYTAPLSFYIPNRLIAPNETLAEHHLKVTSLGFKNVALVANGASGVKVYYGDLTIEAQALKQTIGGNMAPRVVASIYVTVNASNVITACGSVLPVLPASPIVPPPSEEAALKYACTQIDGTWANGKCTINQHQGCDH